MAVVLWLSACAPPTPVVIEEEVSEETVMEKVVTAMPEPLPEGAKIILGVGTGDSGEGLNRTRRSSPGSRRRTPTSWFSSRLWPDTTTTRAC